MKVALDMSGDGVAARFAQASALSDLRPELRLDAKLDMSPQGIARRIAEASGLRTLCMQLAKTDPLP